MGVVKNLMVRAGADFSAITKQSNKAKKSMQSMSSSVGKSCSQMTAAANGLKKAFSALGAVLSVTAVINAGKAATEAYNEQAEASTKLAQVMRNTMGAGQAETKAIEDLIDAQERLGVVAGEVQTEGAQELATYLTLSSSLETLIPVMNDMVAQQYGLAATTENAVSIATMMGKVMNGQTSALSRYGYSFTAAQEAVLKYGTEAQRAAVLAEVVSESVGGMNKALAATPSGRLQQVENTLDNIKETFGLAINRLLVLLIPALNTLCSLLERVAVWADKVAQTLVKVFGSGPGSSAASVVTTDAMAESIDGVTSAAESATEAVEGLMGFDQINKLPSATAAEAEPGSSVSVGGALINTSGADEAGETIGWLESKLTSLQEKFAAVDTSKLTGALDRLKEAVAPFKESLFSGLSWALDNIFVPMGTWVVEDALPSFLDTLADSTTNLSPALENLETALQPLREDAFAGLRWAYDNVFIPFASWAGGELLPEFLNTLASGCGALSEAIDALSPLFTWLWDNLLVPAANWTGGAIIDALQTIARMFTIVGDTVSDVFGGIYQIFDGFSAFLKGVFTGDFRLAWQGIKSIFAGTWNSIIGLLEGAVNLMVSGANWLIKQLNKISFTVPDWVPGIGGKTMGVNIPLCAEVKLPRLATGAVIPPNNEFAAILGDNKHEPEVVSPASLMESVFRSVLQDMGVQKSGGSPTKVVIPIYVGGRKVSEKVIEDINDITRTTGECPIKV